MGPERRVLSLLTVLVLSSPIYAETQYLYFSDLTHCDQTYTVARDELIQIEGKRSSDDGTNTYYDCSLLFRAGNLEDKLCMKISTLAFSSNKLQFQYFKSLDPNVGTPDLIYDSDNTASTPIELCDNEYEISMKLHTLDPMATFSEVDLLIEVYSMQGNKRVAYLDTDSGLKYNLSDSTIFVQNTDPDGPNTLESVSQLYFNYVGTESNHICISYQRTMGTCGYELKVYDGPATGSTLAHTYTCSNTQPQQWCGTQGSIYLELVVSGTDPLPVGVFAVEVKDSSKGLTTDPTDPSDPNDDSGLPTGEIIAYTNLVLLGVIFIISMATVIILFCRFCHKCKFTRK